MLRLAHVAPALIGLALAAPPTARAQSHVHGLADCPECVAAARHGTPVVKERRGVIGRLRGGDRVSIPAGHSVAHRGPHATPPHAAAPASWNDQGDHVAEDPRLAADAGHAQIGGDHVAPPPPLGIGAVSAGSAEPMPIGEMRTSYVTPLPHSAPTAPMAPTMAHPAHGGGFAGVPVIPPDPSIQMWHRNRMSDRAVPYRSGPLETMLGISSFSNWVEQRRTIRAMRASAKKGMYAPSMHEMPSWAVNGR